MTKIPYVTFMKHAQKVVKSPSCKTRPVLGGVIHREDYIAVTDSHRLYFASDMYEGEEKNVNPVTGTEIVEGNYPDVLRLIQDIDNAKHVYTIDVTRAYEAVRAIELASKLNRSTTNMNIVAGSDYIEFKTEECANFEVSYKAQETPKRELLETATFDIKYVKEALHVLKDAKFETFTLEYFDKHRPAQLRAGNFTAIILPLRENN